MQVEFEVFYFAKFGRDEPVYRGLYINKNCALIFIDRDKMKYFASNSNYLKERF